jgi:hypothetical protein
MIETMNDMTSPISINITDLSNATIIEPNISNDDALLLQKQKMAQLKKARNEQIKEELIKMVCRQSDLTNDEARERLENEQYNYMKVLNNYFGIKDTKSENPTTINQQIYGEIRTLMDTGAKGYRMEQERSQYIQKMNEQRTMALQSSNSMNTEK